MKYVCSKCGHEEEIQTLKVKCDCGGLWKLDFHYMPTLSFKDRGAAVLVAYMKWLGIKHAVQDSSGNAGNSVAAYAGRVGIDCEIFVPEGTSDKKIRMIEAHGAKANVVPGNRDHCCEEHGRTRDALISMCGAGLKSDH